MAFSAPRLFWVGNRLELAGDYTLSFRMWREAHGEGWGGERWSSARAVHHDESPAEEESATTECSHLLE